MHENRKKRDETYSALNLARFAMSVQQSLQITYRVTFFTRLALFLQDSQTILPHELHFSRVYSCPLHLSQIKQSPFHCSPRYTGKRI